jgi:ribosomal protein S1
MLSSSDFSPETSNPEGGEQKPESMESHAGYDQAMRALTPGQIVTGLVVQIDESGALVDVGTKSEGMIPQQELGERITEDGKPLAVGDSIEVYVLKPEDEDGAAVLSKKRADYESLWKKIILAHEQGEILTAMVVERVRGGLVVDLGVRAFLPASHVSARSVQSLDSFVGRSIKLKILEVDRERKRVVVSHREAMAEIRDKRRDQTLGVLKEGEIRKGIVRRLTDYGAFVDIGGVDGLLHVTEISWSYITHPSEALKVGEHIEVMVLKLDMERERISLGLKQILPDPWEEVGRKYHVGDVVKGKITRVVQAGAFIRLAEGIEGIIPATELGPDKRTRAEDVDLPKTEIEAKIIAIRPSERRITLSLRLAHQDKERKEAHDYMTRQATSGRVTLGDLFGESLAQGMAEREARAEAEASTQAAEEPRIEAAEPAAAEPIAPAAEPEVTEEAPAESVDAPEESVAEAIEEVTCEPSDSPEASAPEKTP